MKLKGLFFIFSLLVLTSCSQDNKPGSNEAPQSEQASTSTLIEFGTLKTTDGAKLMTATIFNDTAALIPGPATISSSDFTFISGYNCPNGAKARSSCSSMKLTFAPAGKAPGEYNATINLGSISIPLHATIEAPVVPTQEELAGLITSSLGDEVDFGTVMSSSGAVIKTITLTNGTNQTVNVPVLTTSLAPFVLSYDACSNKAITKGKSCQIKVSLNPAGLSGAQVSSLSYFGKEVDFKANVATPESVAQSGAPVVVGGFSYSSNLQFFVGNSPVSSYEFANGIKIVALTVKNTGNLAAPVSTLTLTGPSEYSLSSNSCVSKSLAPNATCSVRVVVAGSNQPSSSSVTMGNVTLPITVAGPASSVQLTVVKSGNGAISDGNNILCNESCSTQTATYPVGTVVTLVSTPSSGFVVGSYSGACSGLSPVCQITLTANTSVNVNFVQELKLAATKLVRVNQSLIIEPTLGLAPYIISKTSGVGTLTGNSFTAGNLAGNAIIRVQDQLGSVKNMTVTVAEMDGTPNSSVGTDGLVKVTLPSEGGYSKASISDNGDIFLMGSSYSGGNQAILKKFSIQGIEQFSISAMDYSGSAVRALADGGVIWGLTGNNQAEIRKYNSELVLDSNFANGGILVMPVPEDMMYQSYPSINYVMSDKNSSLYVIITYYNGMDTAARILKYSNTGNLIYSYSIPWDAMQNSYVRLAPLDDGSIIIASNRHYYYGLGIVLQKITPAGVLDVSYGTEGTVLVDGGIFATSNGGMSVFGNLGVLTSGSAIVSSSIYDYDTNENYPVFTKVSATGQVDLSFGDNGVIASNFGYSLDYPHAVQASGSVDTTGNRILFGLGLNGEGPTSNIQIGRLNENGTLDSEFNEGQLLTTTPGVSNTEFDLRALPSGEIVWSGITGYYNENAGTWISEFVIKRINSVLTNGPVIPIGGLTLYWGGTQPLAAVGGEGPYEYQVVSGDATISSSNILTAGNSSGSIVVQVTDAQGKQSNVTVNVIKFSIVASATKKYPGQTATFSVSKGAATPSYSYTFEENNSGGSLSGGVYTAGNTYGVKDKIRMTDASGNYASATISVEQPITVSPTSVTVGSTLTQTFSASGGSKSGYEFSLVTPSSIGSTISPYGHFVAGNNTQPTPVVEQVKVVDSEGNTTFATVNVIRISGAVVSQTTYNHYQYTAAGNTGSCYMYNISIFPTSMVMQSTGKSVHVIRMKTTCANQATRMFRLNTDGTIDNTFGNVMDSFNNQSYADLVTPLNNATPIAAGVDSSDRLYVIASSYSTLWVARFNSNGTLDTSYGNAGRMTVNPSPSTECATGKVEFTTDGKMLGVFQCFVSGNNYSVTSIRVNTNGTADSSYGTNGVSTLYTGVSAEYITAPNTSVSNEYNPNISGILSDNSFVVAVTKRISGTLYASIIRVKTDGTVDTSWNGGTGSALNHPYYGSVGALKVLNNKIYVSRTYNENSLKWQEVDSFNPDGTVNTSFGNNGVAKTSELTTPYESENILQDVNGLIYVADGSGGLFRFNPAGDLDKTFGSTSPGYTQIFTSSGYSIGYVKQFRTKPNGNLEAISSFFVDKVSIMIKELTNYY